MFPNPTEPFGLSPLQWANLWAEVESTAIAYTFEMTQNPADAEIIAGEAVVKAAAEIATKIRLGALRFTTLPALRKFVGQRAIWRCADIIRAGRFGRTVSLDQPVRHGAAITWGEVLANGEPSPFDLLSPSDRVHQEPPIDPLDPRSRAAAAETPATRASADPLDDPGQIELLQRICPEDNPVLVATVHALLGYRRLGRASGVSRNAFVAAICECSVNSVPLRLRRLRALLGIKTICPARGNRGTARTTAAPAAAAPPVDPMRPRLMRGTSYAPRE